MQIDQIETFLDLCETRSFNRTAERLGVTQSTVSARVNALERALGCRLLLRSRAGTALTTEGLRFEPHARSLRHVWAEARHAARDPGNKAMTLRIGLQRDLTDHHIGNWLNEFRKALPETGFYVEADFSVQMCADLVSGALDLAVMFSPRLQPDLHFESVGEVAYRMVSDHAASLSDVRAEAYIAGNFSPAFAHTHAALLPGLTAPAVSSGQSATVAGLLLALGGSAYVLENTATELIRSGQVQPVADAPRIAQTVYAAVHLRHRHRAAYRRFLSLLRGHFARQ